MLAKLRWLLTLCCVLVLHVAAFADETTHADIVVADFESATYGEWQVEGDAFGDGPATGTLPGQMEVSGYQGKRLVNSFTGGDQSTGTLTSPEFQLDRPWLNFWIGGGGHAGETCMNLIVDGEVVRTATGGNTQPGGREELHQASWSVTEFAGKSAVLQIVDQRSGGWGHINVDHIVLSDTKAAPTLVALAKTLKVDGTHLIVPVANSGERYLLGIYDGDKLVQNFQVALPRGDAAYWLAAYPLDHFAVQGKSIRLAPVDGAELPDSYSAAFDLIEIGAASDAVEANDYDQPYRDQFHITTRRGWNNDPNGMVYHDGKYHLYYQHNPFGISWGNMHWGHFESTDLIHWEEQPITLFQKTVKDMMFSGGGFIDFDDSAGLGKGTLFVAFTSTGRGECLAYSTDGGATFTELEENPVVEHVGRDPKIIWYQPEQKWVMAVFDNEECAETKASAPSASSPADFAHCNIAFWESKNLRQWKRSGAFTDPDRSAVFECPELFELPVQGDPGESRWILYGAQNRYFIGRFDGTTFHKESGPHGGDRGVLYAAQTFSDSPDGRRIQIGWLRTQPFNDQVPDQIVSQSFSLPQELTLRNSSDGLRVFMQPVNEVESLRGELLTDSVHEINACQGELSEVLIEFETAGEHELLINGINATFNGKSARIFVDRAVCEIFIDGGAEYKAAARTPDRFGSTETAVLSGGKVQSLTVYRLESIWAAK